MLRSVCRRLLQSSSYVAQTSSSAAGVSVAVTNSFGAGNGSPLKIQAPKDSKKNFSPIKSMLFGDSASLTTTSAVSSQAQSIAVSSMWPASLIDPPSLRTGIAAFDHEDEFDFNDDGMLEVDDNGVLCIKRTYNPSTLKRRRKHGYLQRLRDAPHVIQSRRRKGRKRVSPA